MQLTFPPPNPNAFSMDQSLFANSRVPSLETANRPDNISTHPDYLEFWNHFVRDYWSELYDRNAAVDILQKAQDYGTGGGENNVDPEDVNAAKSLQAAKAAFKYLIEEFERGLNAAGTQEARPNYLATVYGITDVTNGFYNDNNYSAQERLRVFKGFIKQSHIGQKRFSIYLWAWEFILKFMKKIQESAANAAIAQRWMSRAQLSAIGKMGSLTYVKQNSAQDFNNIHANQLVGQKLDILRGMRGDVGKRSSTKQQEVSAAFQRYNETNTFLRAVVEQMEAALRNAMQ